MVKKKPPRPTESQLFLRSSTLQPSQTPIIDTHTHILSTYQLYKEKYPEGRYANSVFDFVGGAYEGRNVGSIVDVFCELPMSEMWKELADAAVQETGGGEESTSKGRWGSTEYFFVMGMSLLL